MENENQLYEVEIKSMALIKEDKKGLITYYKGGTHKDVVMNVRKHYPQYTKPEDKPVIDIRDITQEEYNERFHSDVIQHKGVVLEGETDISEIMEN